MTAATMSKRTSKSFLAIKLFVAFLGLRLLAPSFVNAPRTPNSSSTRVAMRAEGETEGEEEGGMLDILKVEQDIELSPEEYKMALEQEIETQRKKYYIGGKVSPKNLVVPWRPVDEKQLEKDARRTLKKNGIKDPSGLDVDMEYEDSEIELTVVDEDVMLAWAGGIPGTKVGYIIERKPAGSTNYEEIATYDNMQNPQLLAKPYSGHEYSYTDSMVPPGKYDYRLLCRSRDGGITVVDQKDIIVAEPAGLDLKFAFLILGGAIAFSGFYGFFLDPGAQP